MKKANTEVFSTLPIGKVRGFWDSRPCNINHSPLPVGSEGFFDEVEARKYFVEPHIPAFAQFERWKGKKVLEIGCGIGTDTINFARAGAVVTAIDLSPRSLELAQERARIFGLSGNITFVEGDIECLNELISPSEKFDLIYSFGVIHHTPRPERVVRHIRNHLSSSGEFRVMVYHRRSWKVLQMMVASRGFLGLDKMIAWYSEAQEGCPVTYAYTSSSLRELFADFHVDDTFVDHIFPYDVSHYRQYRYKLRPEFRLMPRSLFRFLERKFGWHLCITGRLPKGDSAQF